MEVMQLLLSSMRADGQDAATANDMATFDFVLPACARIANALGAQFEPFLPTVMPPLLQAASQVTEFSMVDADEVCGGG